MEKSDNRFDNAIRGLMDHCRTVIKTREKACSRNAGINPILKALNGYEKLYNHETSDPELHKDSFLDIYRKNKIQILKGFQNDDWMKEGKVKVMLGEGPKARERCIMLSTIYSTAVTLSDNEKKDLEGLPDSAWENCHTVNYPDIFMLYLYRIFREIVTDSKDKESLNKLVNEIEKELDVEEDSVVTAQIGSNGGSPLDNVFSTLATTLGLGNQFNTRDIASQFTNILEQPQVKNMLSGAMAGIQSRDPSKIMETLSSVLPPEMTHAVTGMMANVVSSQAPAAQEPVPIQDGEIVPMPPLPPQVSQPTQTSQAAKDS